MMIIRMKIKIMSAVIVMVVMMVMSSIKLKLW